MKKYMFKISSFILLFSSVIYSGCDKSKLELLPNSPTEDVYFKNETEYNKAVLGVYAKLTDLYAFNGNNPQVGFFFLPGDDKIGRAHV